MEKAQEGERRLGFHPGAQLGEHSVPCAYEGLRSSPTVEGENNLIFLIRGQAPPN